MLRGCSSIFKENCSQEILVLLVKSPGLKSFRGNGHTVLAQDAVDSAEWSCVGLEELDIEIVGIPQPQTRHLQALKNLWKLDPFWFKTTIDEAVITAGQQEGELAQIRQRLQQLGHEPTSNEIQALEWRHASHALERKVFQRLGRLIQLRNRLWQVVQPCVKDFVPENRYPRIFSGIWVYKVGRVGSSAGDKNL